MKRPFLQTIKSKYSKLWKDLLAPSTSHRGFSLIEALISMVIMAGALILLSNTWGSAFRALKKGKQQYEVSVLLERKITEIELEFRGKPLTEIPDERPGDFGSNYPKAKWKMTSKKFEFPDVTALLKSRDQGSDDMSNMIFTKLRELLNKSIKEVKITVMITEGKKIKEFSAVTYFVDYDQNIMLNGF